MPVGVTFSFRAVETPLQRVKSKGEEGCTGQADDFRCPTGKEPNVTKVVMGELVPDYQRDLLVSGATLVKAS
jgi:hypothetical protein